MGPPGSGKSTLARDLGSRLNLPVVHLDQLYHGPGWRPRPTDDFRAAVAEAVARPGWVIDGNYTSAIADRLAVADLVILLDLPHRVTLPRLIRRIATGLGRVRTDSAPGCPERLDPRFLGYAWTWPRAVRPRIMLALIAHQDRVRRISDQRDLDRLLGELT